MYSERLATVKKHVQDSREAGTKLELLVKNQCWSQAIAAKGLVEYHQALAGVAFLLWILAELQLPREPTAAEIEQEYAARRNHGH